MSSTALLTLSTSPVTGTWGYTNSAGLTFDLQSAATITHLGIYDSAGNGISGTRTVYITDPPGLTTTIYASATFSADGTLEGVFRYKSITPVTLSAGSYMVWVDEMPTADPAWQTGDGGTWSVSQCGGRAFLGGSYYGTSGSRPSTSLGYLAMVPASLKVQDEGATADMAMGVVASAQQVSNLAVSASLAMGATAAISETASLSAAPALAMAATVSISATASLAATPAMAMDATATGEEITSPTADGEADAAMSMASTATIEGVFTGSYVIQAQRTAWEVEPGYLPGLAAFDGTEGTAFGEDAGDVQTITPIVFVGLLRGGSVGQIVGTPVALPVEEVSETDVFAVTTDYDPVHPAGSFVPRVSSFAVTDTPIQGVRHNIGDGEHYGTLDSINSQIRNDGGTPATADIVPRTRELLYWRLWTDAAEAAYVAMEADNARGWLHLSATTKIKTYYAQSGGDAYSGFPVLQLAFSSAEHAEVSTWRKIVALAHYGGRLALLGESDTNEYTVFLSADAGLTIEESLVVTDALSALIFYVAARDWLVVLWEDSSTHQIKRKVSLDGGETWSSSTDCQYLPTGEESVVDLEGTLQDKTGMPHAGGAVAIVVTPPSSSTAMVLISQDGGSEWRQVL